MGAGEPSKGQGRDLLASGKPLGGLEPTWAAVKYGDKVFLDKAWAFDTLLLKDKMKGMKTRIRPSEGSFDPWGGTKRMRKGGSTLFGWAKKGEAMMINFRLFNTEG